MYKISKYQATKLEPLTFAELNMQEKDIEELLRQNIDMVCDEEESMLIVGKQVRNASRGRSDLTAFDNEGDILQAKDREDEGELLGNGNVLVDGNELTLNQWLKELYGWSSVQTYAFTVHKDSGKTLSEIRKEYMEKL